PSPPDRSEHDGRINGHHRVSPPQRALHCPHHRNLVVLAAHIVAGDPTIFSYVLSVPVFMIMLLLTRLLAGGLERAGVPTLQPLLLLQLFFLVALLWICIAAGPWRDANAILAVIAGI